MVLDLIESHGERLYISKPIEDEIAEVPARKLSWSKVDLVLVSPLWQRSIKRELTTLSHSMRFPRHVH